MNFLLDTHTHSVASGHAYSTIQEMTQAAIEKGLALLGISEHGPAMEGSCDEIYFRNLKVVPRKQDNFELLFGVEANIIDYKGKLDIKDSTFACLDYGIASLHTNCLEPGTKVENTNAYLYTMENPNIQVIGHPDDGRYSLDYVALVKQAKDTKTLLEVNNTSLSPNCFRANARENYKEMLSLCAEYEVPIIINSDAHISYDVGNFTYAIPFLKELDFPTNLIANLSVDHYKKLLQAKK